MATSTVVVARGRRLNRPEKLFIAAVLIPVLAHFLLFHALPVLFSFGLSFTNWRILKPPAWIGVQNYVRLMKDPIFWIALRNTFLFTAFFVPPMLAVPLALAVLVNRPTAMAKFYRIVYFLPVVTSFVVFCLIFEWIFQSGPNGLANVALGKLGLHSRTWLEDRHLALPLLAMLGVLKGAAWNMVYFLAGLQGIPDTLYEAAKVDGASPWRTFWRITLPLLRPTIFFVSVLTTIGAFQVFDSAYILTGGGPAYATTTIVYFIYTAGFESFQMGYASCSAYVLLLLILMVTWIQKRFLGKTADWY